MIEKMALIEETNLTALLVENLLKGKEIEDPHLAPNEDNGQDTFYYIENNEEKSILLTDIYNVISEIVGENIISHNVIPKMHDEIENSEFGEHVTYPFAFYF